MSKRKALLAAAAALAAGIVGAASITVANWAPAPPLAVAVASGAAQPATSPPVSAATPIPGARAGSSTPSPDTTLGEDQRLREDFGIVSTPVDTASAFSREQALARAKHRCPSYAKEARAITLRHVLIKKTAALSESDRANMTVVERPKDLDVWMVTFHKVRAHRHGPSAATAPEADSNYVLLLSAQTGEFVEACAYGPVN